jgi:hypothetical protein
MQAIITPEEAFRLLAIEPPFARRQVPAHVEFLARQMESGQFNNDLQETVWLFPNGAVANGRHRFQAVIRTGFMLVVNLRILAHEADYWVLDLGRPRLSSTGLQSKGDRWYVQKTSGLNYFLEHSGAPIYGRALGAQELLDLIDSHPLVNNERLLQLSKSLNAKNAALGVPPGGVVGSAMLMVYIEGYDSDAIIDLLEQTHRAATLAPGGFSEGGRKLAKDTRAAIQSLEDRRAPNKSAAFTRLLADRARVDRLPKTA